MTPSSRRISAFTLAMLLAPGTALAQAASAGAFPETPSDAQSQPSREECLAAHKSAQELKQASKFLEAQQHLVICSSATCPGVVISDCGTWIGDLDKMTPSMIFEVRANGKEAPDAKVFVNENPVTDLSQAVKVNPGRHSIRVELPPFPPHEETLTLPEGQRMRLVSVDFRANEAEPLPPTPTPTPVREPERPTPVIVYPLLGVGLAGFASFGVFTLLGQQKQKDLEETCAPDCTDEDLEPMKKMYLIGDISAGVGAAALLTSAIVYLARPTRMPANARAPLSIGVGSVAGGPSDSFGITASGAF